METEKNKNPQEAAPSCQYDLLDDPAERSARYYVPGVGLLHMHYAGNYTEDCASGRLDPVKFQPTVVLSFGMPYMDVAFKGFEPAVLPNPDGLLYGPRGTQPLNVFQHQLDVLARNLKTIDEIVARHFPRGLRMD